MNLAESCDEKDDSSSSNRSGSGERAERRGKKDSVFPAPSSSN